MDDLSSHINIGKDTEKKLKQLGIDTFEKLRTLGYEQAFIQFQTMDPGACLSLLYGLAGAIDGVKWNKLSPERKLEVQEFYKMTKKLQK